SQLRDSSYLGEQMRPDSQVPRDRITLPFYPEVKLLPSLPRRQAKGRSPLENLFQICLLHGELKVPRVNSG
ncbi:hypothetical protein AVEN_239641-1, partial [Araneus ventricosus]